MSLNIGNDAIEAAQRLHRMGDEVAGLFGTLRNAIGKQARDRMNEALDTGEHRDVAIGYARAMRDLYVAFEAAVLGQRPAQVEKPSPAGGRRAS